MDKYLIFLKSGTSLPEDNINSFKKAFSGDSWEVKAPSPVNDIYTFSAEKNNLTFNLIAENNAEEGGTKIVSVLEIFK